MMKLAKLRAFKDIVSEVKSNPVSASHSFNQSLQNFRGKLQGSPIIFESTFPRQISAAPTQLIG